MEEFQLSEEEKQNLLELARAAIRYKLIPSDENFMKLIDIEEKVCHLTKRVPVFVTLKEHGELRGQKGYLTGIVPLWKAVEDVAIAAALLDPQSPPLKIDELEDIEIEISIPSLQTIEELQLSDEEKLNLLKLARATIHYKLDPSDENLRKLKDIEKKVKHLTKKLGVMVTLEECGEFRGYAGHVVGVEPLWKAVEDLAIITAFEHPDFPPLQIDELEDIEIEISILSPLQEVKNIEEIEVGRDGLVVKNGFSQGLLLPQVAIEWGWDRNTFLSETCLEAGLDPDDCLEDPDTLIYKFSAIVFRETDF